MGVSNGCKFCDPLLLIFEKNIPLIQEIPSPDRLANVATASSYWKGKGKGNDDGKGKLPVEAIQSYARLEL